MNKDWGNNLEAFELADGKPKTYKPVGAFWKEKGEDDEQEAEEFDGFDESLLETDFSELTGKNFKKSFAAAKKKVSTQKGIKKATKIVSTRKSRKPLNKEFAIKQNTFIETPRNKGISRVIVPNDRKVIIEGVNKFILTQDPQANSLKNMKYYNGERLKEMVLIFNNDSAVDFNLELFNPSMPLDYLISNGQNLNDKIQVGGNSGIAYSDLLFNILANPTMLVNAKFVFSGPLLVEQINVPISVKNKEITGYMKIDPLNISLNLDTMQVQSDIVYFTIADILNRPFIPDGMDVMGYTVKAGMTVTMAFFYKQISLKKEFFREAAMSRTLL